MTKLSININKIEPVIGRCLEIVAGEGHRLLLA